MEFSLYAQVGHSHESRYAQLRQEYTSILRKCCRSKLLQEGRRVHARIISSGHTRDRFLGNLLVQMYRDCGSLDDAKAVFDAMPVKNEFSWAIIISAYVSAGKDRQAVDLYEQLVSSSTGVQPDAFIFSSVLAACGRLKCLELGVKVHEAVVERGVKEDVELQNSLLTMYSRCGSIDRARAVFNRIKRKDVVTWNAMLAANAKAGHLEQALEIYEKMVYSCVKPDAFTYASVIDALAGLDRVDEAVLLHSKLGADIESDAIVGTSLIGLYSSCRKIESAREVFDRIVNKDVLCWNTMLAAEAAAGQDSNVLKLYRRMDQVRPNQSTFATFLAACTRLGDLAAGVAARKDAIRLGLDRDAVVGTGLVILFASRGELIAAKEAFDQIKKKDTISWSAMVAVYARNGHGREAMETFRELCLQGISLDAVAFTNILGTCSHSGLLEEMCECFAVMSSDYGIVPEAEHYRCVITGLGRCGRTQEAEELIRSMKLKTDTTAWMTLLHACKTHEVGADAGVEMIKLLQQSADGSAYVAVSNLYKTT